MTYELSRYVNFFNFFKIMLDKLLFYVYYITCVRVNLFSHFHFNTYARVAQWWSTSLPRRGSRVRSPSRALLDKKGLSRLGSPFLLSKKCDALLELILLRSIGSESTFYISNKYFKSLDSITLFMLFPVVNIFKDLLLLLLYGIILLSFVALFNKSVKYFSQLKNSLLSI